jgi:alpha-L-fucosidase
MGPGKNIVSLFEKAGTTGGATVRGQRSPLLSYKCLAVRHGSDKKGSQGCVPYDGADPANADLYHDNQHSPGGLPPLIRDAENESSVPEEDR